MYWVGRAVTALSAKESVANGVNALGQIVGSNYFSGVGSDSIQHATVWNPDGTSTDLTPNDFVGDSIAHAINGAGAIVGYDGFATLWENGAEYNLNTLIAPNSGLTLYDALDINDSGQIVGQGRDSSGVEYAYVLNPVPEPAAGFLLTGCAAILLKRTRRSHAIPGIKDSRRKGVGS